MVWRNVADSLVGQAEPERTTRLVLLLDHDNIDQDPKTIVTTALGLLSSAGSVVDATLRAYGGWFEGAQATESRYRALASYQDTCPVILQSGTTLVRLSFEFADELAIGRLVGSPVHISHTVGIRRSAGGIIAGHTSAKCTRRDCQLPQFRRWVRKKTACSAPACPFAFEDFFQRREQKQVDVHMAVDLLCLASTCGAGTAIAVVSDDLDILPALIQASLQNPNRRLLHVRSDKRPPTYQDGLLFRLGVLQVAVPQEST